MHLFGPLIRAIIALTTNGHRLSANKVPTAVLSVYLDYQLEKVFSDIKNGALNPTEYGGCMDLELSQTLSFNRDLGDRNRTSLFIFARN